MGFKRDKFVVKIKSKFEEVTLPVALPLLPEKYHLIFSKLWNHFQCLGDIIDSNNYETIAVLLKSSNPDEIMIDVNQFFGLYREKDCLQQVLREIFFDTVVIIQNVYSPYGVNLFQVLEKDQLINISFEKSLSADHLANPLVVEEDADDRTIAKVYAEDLISEDNWVGEEPAELKYLRKKVVNMREDIDSIQYPL